MNKLLTNVTFNLLFQLVKTERRFFQCNRNNPYLVLSQQNGCEGMYGYRINIVLQYFQEIIQLSVRGASQKSQFYLQSLFSHQWGCAKNQPTGLKNGCSCSNNKILERLKENSSFLQEKNEPLHRYFPIFATL